MAVLEDLDEADCYLLAILEDESGIDLAELTWVDFEQPDLCFRAWPFQVAWWRDESPMQVDQCGRAVGKTLSITLRGYAFPFNHPGQEMLITAPELVHLEPLTSLVERRFRENRLGREMLPPAKSSVTHRPFQANFANGSRIIGRIPQRDGRGVKGAHPLWLEQDEASDYPEKGWVELVETLKRGSEGAVWRSHGVTRGLRDKFYEITQDAPDNPWSIHRVTGMHRPNWTDQERQEKIKLYGGSKEHPDYRRNILGAHGDAQSAIFVLGRLMACADDDLTSDYNEREYTHIRVSSEMLTERGQDLDVVQFLDFPASHRTDYKLFWIGMDVGVTNHPSEIVVFAEHRPPKAKDSVLKLITRVHLERVATPAQCRAVVWLMDYYKPRAFAVDKTGLGLPMFQQLQEMAPAVAKQIKGYNFSEKILVGFDESIDLKEGDDDIKEAGLMKQVLEWSTDVMRDLVDHKRLVLPWDVDFLGQLQGQTWTYAKASFDAYGRRQRVFSQGTFHAFDAARMACLAFKQEAIEAMLDARKNAVAESVYDNFVMIA